MTVSDFLQRAGGYRASLAFKAPCKVATTGNITLSGTQTIDGVALVNPRTPPHPSPTIVVIDDVDQPGRQFTLVATPGELVVLRKGATVQYGGLTGTRLLLSIAPVDWRSHLS